MCGSSRLRVCHLEPPPTAGSTPVTSFLASLSLCVSTVMLLSLLLASSYVSASSSSSYSSLLLLHLVAIVIAFLTDPKLQQIYGSSLTF